MDELFCCRNCIHNCGQSLSSGPGAGFCLKHESVIPRSETTTCKYLHRKDLPSFVVDEGIREHAAEFALFPRLVDISTKNPIERVPYSEQYSWERGEFNSLNNALAQYFKVKRWVFIQAFAGASDGLRSLAHCCLVRHYMDQCGTWTSSYRLVLGVLSDIDETPHFSPRSLFPLGEAEEEEAIWDVVIAKLATLQEYGWHAGIEELMWASDAVNGALAELDWPALKTDLATRRDGWIQLIITHAKSHDEFFPKREVDDDPSSD